VIIRADEKVKYGGLTDLLRIAKESGARICGAGDAGNPMNPTNGIRSMAARPFPGTLILFGVAWRSICRFVSHVSSRRIRSKTQNHRTPSLTVIDMRDVAIDRILQKGMFVPPNLPPTVVKPVDLSFPDQGRRCSPYFAVPGRGRTRLSKIFCHRLFRRN
jgi:hypothetical protein